MELAAVIREGLTKFVNSPQVTVSVSMINSRRIYVTGEVTRPGAFPLLPDMTVLQALTSAGGLHSSPGLRTFTSCAWKVASKCTFRFNYKAVVGGRRSEDNIQLQPGDTIVVP